MLGRLVHILNRKTVLIILILALTLGTYSVTKYIDVLIKNIGNVVTIGGIIIAASMICIKYPKIYFVFMYIKALFLGEQTLWNISSNFYGNIDIECFNKLKSELQNISKNSHIYVESEYIYNATLDGINVTLSLAKSIDQEEYQKLHFQIIDFRAAYEDTLIMLERVILPYLRKADHVLKPDKSDFELCIDFINGNPWAKAVTKGISYENILAMDFLINIEDGDSKGRISIGKKDLRVSCNELNILTSIIKKRLIPTI